MHSLVAPVGVAASAVVAEPVVVHFHLAVVQLGEQTSLVVAMPACTAAVDPACAVAVLGSVPGTDVVASGVFDIDGPSAPLACSD